MKNLFFTILCLLFMTQVLSQTKKYELTAEGNALMCPFMGPRLTKQLELVGVINISKSPTHGWNFEMAEKDAVDKAKIVEIIQKVGYNPTTFHIKIDGNE